MTNEYDSWADTDQWRTIVRSLVVAPEGSDRSIELDEDLIDKQKLNAYDVIRIILLNTHKIQFIDKMDECPEQAKYYASMIEEIDGYLHTFWKLPQQPNE